MDQPTNFVDIDRAREIVAQLYPNAQHIELIDHGYDNIVALVDRQYAVRFPRNAEALVRSRYEQAMLGKLDAVHAVKTPQFLYEKENPPYLVTTYVPGQHLTPEDIDQFSAAELQEFGKTLGRFAYELHSSIAVEDEQKFRLAAQLGDQFDASWGAYFDRVVNHGMFTSPLQTTLAQQYYQKWLEVTAKTTDQVVIHDDLHIANMLFQDNRLVSVLDFGEANIGTAEQELRQLYRINQQALDVAVETYNQLAGRQLDKEAIRVWAIMQDLGSYSRRLSAGETDHPRFIRSAEHLNKWLPEGHWGVTAS